MTYYARVIDNITNKEVLGWLDTYHSRNWYYGKVSSFGGESQYVVEIDIWNNEPAWNSGTYDEKCADATNCRFTVWADNECRAKNTPLFSLDKNFMFARCITNDYKSKFNTFIRNDYMFKDIVGNVNPNKIGVIHGNCDHAILQTKIILPEATNLESDKYNFIMAFYYDYED